jgi:hypothetical protein
MSDVTYDKRMLQEAADEILYAPDLLMHIFEKTGRDAHLQRAWENCSC